MSKIYSKIQSLAANYEVLSDPDEGAIGTVRLGIFIPKNAAIISSQVCMKSILVSAGDLATISFGYITIDKNDSNQSDVNVYFPATVISTINTAGVINELPVDDQQLQLPYAVEVTMSIGVEALTEGELTVAITYIEYNS